MFLRAGFNAKHTVVCRARVRLKGETTVHSAELIRFVPSGDLAWHSRTGGFLVWGNRISFAMHPSDHGFPWLHEWECPSSHVETYYRKVRAAREAGCLAVLR